MGGAGKTTLLRHLAGWWHTTGFVLRVFSFGYDEKAWTLQQIMIAIAQTLYGPKYYTDFQPLPLAAQQAMLTQDLRANNDLLILDNLESITGAQLAIQHILPPDEQAALHSFLADLARGHTLILLGSRGGEDWLARDTFVGNVYDLGGLDPEAASTLADRILARHNATQYRQDTDLQHLLKLLDGFPLALEVVLANLAHQAPVEVLAALQAGDVTLNTGDSQEKTENILRCIDYSHSNLSPEAQQLLLCLAPFTSVIDTGLLDDYTTHLKQQSTLAALPFERRPQVLREATNWGLLRADAKNPRFLHIQPTLPYFLRHRLHIPEQAELRTAVETAFRKLYDQLGASMYELLESKDPHKQQVGQLVTHLEYENLLTTLNLALTAQISILNPYIALSTYLDATQNHQRGLELCKNVLNLLDTYSLDKLDGPLGAEFSSVIEGIANRQLLLKQYAAAEASYQKALSILLENKSYDVNTIKKLSASIYHNLGMVAQEQHQWKEAEAYLQQALQIEIDFHDHYAQANAYHSLGVVAQKQHHWKGAEAYYKRSLQIKIDLQDRFEQANTYHQLGMLAQEQCQWEEAEAYLQQALHIYIDFHDHYAQAKIYHELGYLGQEQHQWEEAEEYFQQALQLCIEYNDHYHQALIYHNLGAMAQKQCQWEEAEAHLQQAMHIFINFHDRYNQAGTYHNLGIVAQEQQQWSQAREYFLKALETFSSYKDDHNSSKALYNLALLWQAGGDADLPAAIASIIDITTGEVKALLRKMLEDENTEACGS